MRSNFSAKVVLVNHAKRIEVDTACSNLAIKYNMLYLSVYQLIRREILAETDLGRALLHSKREKALDFGPLAKAHDPYQEREYSAVHFDQTLVMQLVQRRIAETRTNQRFILLEGFCNSSKLESETQRLQLRYMDEFFAIERNIGEIVGVIGLQNEKESNVFEVTNEMWEEPQAEEEKEEKPKAEGDDDENQEEAAPEDGEAKAPAWNPRKYRWSLTNGKSKNLPQLFRDYMSTRCTFDDKNWKSYQANSHGDAAVKALDEFCQKISQEGNNLAIYMQVIFNDLD